MKETELRANANCLLCGKGIGHTGLPLFWRVTVEPFGVDLRAVQRQDGLAAILGNSLLAMHMGTNEDLAVPVGEPMRLTLCETCAVEKAYPVAALAEIAGERKRREEERRGCNTIVSTSETLR